MKKIIITLVAALSVVAAMALVGCSSTAEAGYTFDKGSFNSKGKTCTIKLNGNPTTGFEWTANQSGDSLTSKSSDYQSSGKGTETGAGGVYSFVYEGTKAGTTTLTFTYARSWETDGQKDTVTVEVTTDGSGSITSSTTKCSDGSGGASK